MGGTADENVIKIKHEVLREVARHAFAGDLEKERDNIPYTLIPGPNPQFRCCIYKEREIIRQRIRLAEGPSVTSPWAKKYTPLPSTLCRIRRICSQSACPAYICTAVLP